MSEIIFHNTKSKREKKKTNRKTKDMVGTSENGSAAVPTNGEELCGKIRDRTRQIDGRTENTEINDGPPVRIFNIYRL